MNNPTEETTPEKPTGMSLEEKRKLVEDHMKLQAKREKVAAHMKAQAEKNTPVKGVEGRTTTTEALLHGASQNIPFMDEAADALEAGTTALFGVDSEGRPSDESYSEAYDRRRKRRKRSNDIVEADRPYTSMASSLVSATGPLGVAGKLGKIRKIEKLNKALKLQKAAKIANASKKAKAATLIGSTGIQGGVDEVSRSEDRSLEDFGRGAKNALTTAGLLKGGIKGGGKLLEKSGKAIKDGSKYLSDKYTGFSSKSRKSNKHDGGSIVGNNARPFLRNDDEAVEYAHQVKRVVEDSFKVTNGGTQKHFQGLIDNSNEHINTIVKAVDNVKPGPLKIRNIVSKIGNNLKKKHTDIDYKVSKEAYKAIDEVGNIVARIGDNGSFSQLVRLRKEVGDYARSMRNKMSSIEEKMHAGGDFVAKSDMDKIKRKGDIFGDIYHGLNDEIEKVLKATNPQALGKWKVANSVKSTSMAAKTMLNQAKTDPMMKKMLAKVKDVPALAATVGSLIYTPQYAIITGIGAVGYTAVRTLGKPGVIKLSSSIERGLFKSIGEKSSKIAKAFARDVDSVFNKKGREAAEARAYSLIGNNPEIAGEIGEFWDDIMDKADSIGNHFSD